MMQEVLIKILVPIAVIAVLTFLLGNINTTKKKRSKQMLMPFIALAYCFPAVFFVMYKKEEIMKLGYEEIALNELTSYLEILVLNVLVMAGFIAVKLVCITIFGIVFRGTFRIKKITETFYALDDDYKEWFLIDKWTTLRNLFRWIVLVGVFVVGGVLGITWYYGGESEWYVHVFPIVAQIVLVEIFNFLNGYTKEEYAHEIMGDNSYSQRISNFYRIREIYESIFPRELLTANTGCDYMSQQEIINLLENMEDSNNNLEQIVAEFFKLNGIDEVYDTDCIMATLKLMRGENVVFFNPFYRDLGKYLVLPLLNTLLTGKKCLIIVGRTSTKEDIKVWLEDLLWEYGKIRTMWRVRDLSFKEPECEIGVLSFSQLYDLQVIETNKAFLQEVGFVFMSEPSLIANTGQVGLSILAQQMCHLGDQPVYCISDRIAEGLVDTMSHVLRAEITEVAAPPVSRNIYTNMAWNADGDYLRQKLFGKQTKFLGNGIELAAVAIKNQIPQVSWFSESKAPIRDIKWIAGQYYSTICKYMNLPVQQQSIYDKIKFIPNIWSVKEEKEQFVIVEDEFTNIFRTMRIFLSRGKDQTFVNVLSENYLLRDYMRCNTQMFTSNPDAIPSIVPDYAKTERNTLIKLLMLMTYREVSETEILHEFHLTGIETDDALHTLTVLLKKYTHATDAIFSISSVKHDYDGTTMNSENVYTIIPEMFEEYFGDSLKNAYYVCEDEKEGSEYIDAKLFGHVTQTIMPGQFVTYDGKYYIVKHISPKNGVVLRRASNLYDGRKYYRQVRKYFFDTDSEEQIVSLRTVMDIEIAEIYKNFDVITTGYLELKSNSDLRNAKLIDYTNDPNVSSFYRSYCNKRVLRIKLPETTDRMRFTMCLLLSEIFRTVFPEAYHYLAVVTVMPETVEGMLNYVVYSVEGNLEEEYIYVIEDSDMDLGLLESVEKNLMNLLEIATDFLYWHVEKMREPAAKDPVKYTAEFPPEDKKRRKKFTEMATRIRQLFGGKKEKTVKVKTVEEAEKEKPVDQKNVEVAEQEENVEESTYSFGVGETTATQGEVSSPEDSQAVNERKRQEATAVAEHPEDKFEPEAGEDPDFVAIDGTDIFDNDSITDDDEYLEAKFAELGITSLEKTRYQEECYLKYGFNEIDSRIQIEEVRKYLTVRGFSNNSFIKARKRDVLTKTIIDVNAVNHCDFCGLPLSGVSYEKLNDGRIRCNDCSASAITSVEEFKELFHRHLRLMESFYGIDYKSPITVKTSDAKVIARGYGSVFTPTTEVAARVLGYAQRRGNQFSLHVENGSPRLATIDTMIHELTHIWQYLNWSDVAIRAAYPDRRHRDIVYEGMAMWAAIQYLYLIGENSYAQQQELLTLRREDIYGIGFKMYCEKYPLIKDSALVKYSPFMEFPPL